MPTIQLHRAVAKTVDRIEYRFANSEFGPYLLAQTAKGICWLGFTSDSAAELGALQASYPQAQLIAAAAEHLPTLASLFASQAPIAVQVQGSDFQFRVWQALIKVGSGQTCSYTDLANAIGQPQAFRAVGNAVGANPVAVLIPCHRVVPKQGGLGGYRWGIETKQRLLDRERHDSLGQKTHGFIQPA